MYHENKIYALCFERKGEYYAIPSVKLDLTHMEMRVGAWFNTHGNEGGALFRCSTILVSLKNRDMLLEFEYGDSEICFYFFLYS